MYNILSISLILFLSTSLFSCTSSKEESPSVSNASLTNTRWVLRVLNDKKIFTPEKGKEAYITLSKDGNKANGVGSCNNFFTTYTLSGKDLSFGPVASTEMFCEGQMDTETAFFKAISNSKTYKISGNYLYLSDSSKVIAKLESVFLN